MIGEYPAKMKHSFGRIPDQRPLIDRTSPEIYQKEIRHDWCEAVIGVNSQFYIPVPIPILWNWFMEWPNSNTNGRIGVSTPTPIPQNWGIQMAFQKY